MTTTWKMTTGVLVALAVTSPAYAIGTLQPGAATPQTLTLPSGPNSVRGLTDAAEVDAFSAQIKYSIPIELPGAVRDFRPSLDLAYAGDLGNGPLGIGWALRIPQIRRSLRLGVPAYTPADEIELVGIGGGGRLVPVAAGAYRVEGKGHSLAIEELAGGGFKLTDASGIQYRFGALARNRQSGLPGTQAWMLESVVDLARQQISFEYLRDADELYLSAISWGPAERYRATLSYAARPDSVISFRRGFAVRTTLRLDQIRIEAAGALRNLYRMSYDDSLPLSRLARVTELGSDGVTAWPELTFHYGASEAPRPVAVANTGGWALGRRGVSFLDVDGDGVPDLTRIESGNHEYRRNLGATFQEPRTIAGASSIDLVNGRVMDLYGDARPELVTIVGDVWNVYRLKGESWTPLGSFVGSQGLPIFGDTVVHLDVNGDGRTDVMRASSGGVILNRNSKDGLQASVLLPPISSDDPQVAPGAPNVRFVDVNGDGLADVVWLTDAWLKIYLGHGDGTFEAFRKVAYPWTGQGTIDPSFLHLGDLNRDGLVDLVRITAGNVELYRGLPGGDFDATPRPIARPEEADVDVVVDLADINGNGSQDLVWSSPRGMWALDLAGSTSAGMLVGIDNGLGKSTRFAYSASAVLSAQAEMAGARWLRTLPISIPVPIRTEIDASGGAPTRVVEFLVRDGFWDFEERRFGGFQTATRHWPDIGDGERFEVTTYHLGLGVTRILRGSPLSVRTYKGALIAANLVSTVTNVWQALSLDGMPDLPLAKVAARSSTRTAHAEGVATPIVTGTDFAYDTLGHLVEERRLGRIDLAGDEQIIQKSYASNDAAWVRDLVIEEKHLDGDGKLASDVRMLYGDETQALPFGEVGKGWLREVVQLYAVENSDVSRWVTRRQIGYDALGQIVAELSHGVFRRFSYDATGLHPVRESVDVQAGQTLSWQLAWDPTLDLPTELTDAAGQKMAVRYDALGRVVASGLSGQPAHTIYTYDWSAPTPRTVTYRFDGAATELRPFAGWQAGQGWRETVEVSNGAGEPVFEATHLDAATYIVKDLKQRDARGRVAALAEPFYAASIDGLTRAPAGVPLQTIGYDALDRRVLQTLPTGGQRRSIPAALSEVEVVTDLAPVTRRLDGLGRIVHTERTVAGVVEQIDARYDAESRIVALSLQGGRVEHRFDYDTLGRLRHGVDPDAGARSYTYDDGDRLLARTNGANQTVSFTYDGLGRPVQSVSGAKQYVYHYDQPRVASAQRTGGRLAWVEEPSGSVDFSYDEQGRQSWMRRTVDGRSAEKTVRFSPSGLTLGITFDDGFAVGTSYDGAARPVQVADLWQALRLDAAGRTLEERYGNGVHEIYNRDAAGLPSRIQIRPESGAALYDVTLARNAMGVLQAVSDGDGVGLDHSAQFGFDAAARLTRAQLGAAANPFSFRYGYDELSNMTTRVSDARSAGAILTGSYRYGENGAGPRQLSSVLAASGDITAFGYDAAGRQTQNGELRLGYDGFDQLAAVTRTGQPLVTHEYGYDGQRVSTIGGDGSVQTWYTEDLAERNGARQHYVRIGGRTLARVDVSPGRHTSPPLPVSAGVSRALYGALALLSGLWLLVMVRPRGTRRRWVRNTAALAVWTTVLGCGGGHTLEPAVRSSSLKSVSVLYFHAGVAAGPVAFTRADGTLAEERRFEPFGHPLEAARPGSRPAPVDFQLEPTNALAKETDAATGFSYHGARWLDPRTARWTQPDPPTKAPDAKFMQAPWQLHPYGYVDQNPVAFWDPDGREPQVSREETFTRDPGYTPNSGTSVAAATPTPAPVSAASSTSGSGGGMSSTSATSFVGPTTATAATATTMVQSPATSVPGGMSMTTPSGGGYSTMGGVPQSSQINDHWRHIAVARHTASVDNKPVQTDWLGNMIAGSIAGGFVTGLFGSMSFSAFTRSMLGGGFTGRYFGMIGAKPIAGVPEGLASGAMGGGFGAVKGAAAEVLLGRDLNAPPVDRDAGAPDASAGPQRDASAGAQP